MTATLNRRAAIRPPASNVNPSSSATNADAARRLRSAFAAVRVAFTWFGVRKSLSAEQKAQTAEQFGADGHYLSAAKKLLDTKHEAFQAVTALRSQIVSYWKGLTLPDPSGRHRRLQHPHVAVPCRP